MNTILILSAISLGLSSTAAPVPLPLTPGLEIVHVEGSGGILDESTSRPVTWTEILHVDGSGGLLKQDDPQTAQPSPTPTVEDVAPSYAPTLSVPTSEPVGAPLAARQPVNPVSLTNTDEAPAGLPKQSDPAVAPSPSVPTVETAPQLQPCLFANSFGLFTLSPASTPVDCTAQLRVAQRFTDNATDKNLVCMGGGASMVASDGREWYAGELINSGSSDTSNTSSVLYSIISKSLTTEQISEICS